MSTCEKSFALTISAAPPSGLQVDAVTVAQENTWASLLNVHSGCPVFTYTGFLPFAGFNSYVGDSGRQTVSTPPQNQFAPQSDWELIYYLFCGGTEIAVASYLKPGPDPTGTYSLQANQPPNVVLGDGFVLPNWNPSPPVTVVVTYSP